MLASTPGGFRPDLGEAPISFTPGATSSAAVALNRKREGYRIVNTGAAVVFIHFGTDDQLADVIAAYNVAGTLVFQPNTTTVLNIDEAYTHIKHIATGGTSNNVQMYQGA